MLRHTTPHAQVALASLTMLIIRIRLRREFDMSGLQGRVGVSFVVYDD